MQEESKKPEMKNATAKAAPRTAPTMARNGKSAPNAKPKKKISGGTILAIVLVVAVIGLGAAVYFDLGGTKQMLASTLGLTTMEEANAETAAQAAAAQADFDTQQAKIKSSQESLSQKEDELDARESELNAREHALSEQEAVLAETVDTADQQAQRDQQLDAAAEIFAQMDAASAAKAIAGMDSVADMAQILMRMPSEQAALIMEKMSSSLATKILSEMVG